MLVFYSCWSSLRLSPMGSLTLRADLAWTSSKYELRDAKAVPKTDTLTLKVNGGLSSLKNSFSLIRPRKLRLLIAKAS